MAPRVVKNKLNIWGSTSINVDRKVQIITTDDMEIDLKMEVVIYMETDIKTDTDVDMKIEIFNHRKISQCFQYKDKTWEHMINRTKCPTKPEELHVKMEME